MIFWSFFFRTGTLLWEERKYSAEYGERSSWGRAGTVDVHVGQLRKKLELYEEIRTIPSLGTVWRING